MNKRLVIILLAMVLLACDATGVAIQISALSSPYTATPPPVVAQATETQTAMIPSPSVTPSPVFLTVMVDHLNLRNTPDATGPQDSGVIARMTLGAKVTWLELCMDNWVKVEWKGQIGWANNQMMDPKVCFAEDN
jgi:SH3-like domain-containing protein